MKTIEQMLRYLVRSKVTEFAVVTDRLPCVKVDGDFQPIDDVAPNTDVVLQMLVSAGGSRYVDSLGPKPVQWSTRVDGVGQIAVNAMMKDDIVQARFKLLRRDPRAEDEPLSISPDALVEDDAVPMLETPVRPAFGLGMQQQPSRVRTAPPPEPELDAPPSSGDASSIDFGPAIDLDIDRGAVAVAAAPVPLSSTYEPDLSAPARPRAGAVPDLATPAFATPAIQPAGAFAPSPSAIPGRIESRPRMPAVTPSQPRLESRPRMPAVTPSQPRLESRPRMPAVAAPPRMDETDNSFTGLLVRARAYNASDLHIVAGRPPLFRVAGELNPRGLAIAEATAAEIALEVTPPRLHELLEKDGSCDFAINDGDGRCRVNVSRQRTGYKVCVRMIPPTVPTLASLGLPEQIGHATHHHQGLIVVTGPTGHGKTATLAAIVNQVNSETTRHIITVEDPVEYVHPRKRAMMSQREVGAHTRSFHNALKASLREDPDVIVVGELRDLETVRMALSASETGHLVISTMNTPSAAKTIDRLIDLFPPGDQAQVRLTLAGGLRLIVSQRLIPNADRNGLVAAAEILPGSISLWSLIRDNKTYQIPSLQQRGKGLGITRFDDSLAELVKQGRTTLEIAKQWAESAEEVEMQALNKRPVVAPPLAKEPNKAMESVGGLFNKAGNLFRKGT